MFPPGLRDTDSQSSGHPQSTIYAFAEKIADQIVRGILTG